MPDEKATPQRDAEEDHDLLTFGEAGTRLHEELVAQQQHIERLRAEDAPEELEQALARLQALRDAAQRNERQPITDAHFEGFFRVTDSSGGSGKRADRATE
jgi:hypothetical protein